MARPPAIGDVLFINLPRQMPPGVEQTGARPAVVVGLPEALGVQRYPTLIVVPTTTQIGPWAKQAPRLYPFYRAGMGGLRYDSVALLDHLRSIDSTRVIRRLGRLTPEEYAPIQAGLEQMMERSG